MKEIFISSEQLDELDHKKLGVYSFSKNYISRTKNLVLNKLYDWLVNIDYYLIK